MIWSPWVVSEVAFEKAKIKETALVDFLREMKEVGD